jgi:hypothetical protein
MFKNIIRKADIILAIALILIGGASSFALSRYDMAGSRVVVEVNGKVYGSYSLSEDRTINVQRGTHTNVVKIKNGEVSVTEATCHNQVCVKHKAIHTTGESIICLPNKVVVKIQGEGGNEYDAISS